MKDIQITTTTSMEELADTIVMSSDRPEDVLDFIMKVDEKVALYEFTEELRDRLTESLEAEDAAA